MRALPGPSVTAASSRSSGGLWAAGTPLLLPFAARGLVSAEMLSVCSSEGDSLGGAGSLVSPRRKEQVPGLSPSQGAEWQGWLTGRAMLGHECWAELLCDCCGNAAAASCCFAEGQGLLQQLMESPTQALLEGTAGR